MFDLAAALSELSEHGFKQTRQRLAVLQVMAGAQSRLSPAEVHAQARQLCPDLGLPTVYRTLDVLGRLGIIRRVHMKDNCEGFAPASLAEGHHVVCVKCGRVAEFTGCNVSDLIPVVMQQTGFHVEEHFLELMGTCDECHRSGASAAGQESGAKGARIR
jgi:Fur family ferric uptake transcriptional regulator